MGDCEKEGGPECDIPGEKKPTDKENGAASDDPGYHREQFHAPITDPEQLEDQEIEIQIEIGGFYPAFPEERPMAEEIKSVIEEFKAVVKGEDFVHIGTEGKLTQFVQAQYAGRRQHKEELSIRERAWLERRGAHFNPVRPKVISPDGDSDEPGKRGPEAV
ncbi:MAG: hypothetical protein Q8S00_15990 [Deltaproteobacteria bacterium]|nr:hypothetical protein [Deltaproteobacteria bacterium]MDZ4341621.1 hypothetical protein [Candidatus Binatia bacterium]